MPNPGSQSKYRSPWTDPSFFPESSVNSTPIQSPSAKLVAPMYRTVACRPSVRVITQPEDRSAILIVAERAPARAMAEKRTPGFVKGRVDGRGLRTVVVCPPGERGTNHHGLRPQSCLRHSYMCLRLHLRRLRTSPLLLLFTPLDVVKRIPPLDPCHIHLTPLYPMQHGMTLGFL